MKRFLLFAIMCVCVSIGTWADSNQHLTDGGTFLIEKTFGTWNNAGKVLVVHVKSADGLKNALAMLNETNPGGHMPPHIEAYQGYTRLSIDTRVFTTSGQGPNLSFTLGNSTTVTLSDDDITALNAFTAETIDMQKMKVSDAFTFSNSTAKYVILPDDWTKAEVKAAGLALSTSANFDAAISMSAGNASLNVTGGTEPSLVAYVNHAGTLRDALLHNYWDQQDYKTIGQSGNCGSLRKLIVMGNICAKDISRKGVYDANGHYVITGVPDENSQTFARNTDGGNLYPFSDVDNATGATDGALTGNYDIMVIDLSGAYVPDEYCMDIVVGYNGTQVSNLREVWMPEDSRFHTVPADYLNINSNYLHQVCIPGNIETIKTRAFAAQGCRINYIWTTGPEGNTKYDNGAGFVTGDKPSNAETTVKFMDPRHDEEDEEWRAFDNPTDYNKFQYGTITLPANLKLIERFAFAGCTSVSDVYVLNATAPECHVDAFSTCLYDANNTVKPEYITDGIVTREAYRQGDFKEFKFMTILHYPVATTDPDIQRYTDPTREYSIATGERDDKGNTIYFPNHSEVSFAYLQGSYGYVWKAWNDDRNWYDQSLKQGYGSGWPLDKASHVATSGGTDWQNAANDLWISNPYTDAKKDRSFYDVTRGDNNQPGEATAPAGLDPYYNTIWNGHYLYPQPETVGVIDEQGNPVMETVPVYDENGNIIYDELPAGATYEGNYIRNEVDVYVKAADGAYYHPLLARNNDGNKPKPWYSKTQQQVADPNGDYIWTNTIGNQYNYTECSTWLTWGHTETELAEKRATGWTFSFEDVWVKDENNGTHYISNEYATYSEDATDYVEGVNDTRFNKEVGYVFTEATSSDAGPFWTMRTQVVQAREITKANDYRGWHQFVLTGYSANTIVPYEYLRSFISDNEWWTICEPFDLRYSDMVMFFGTKRSGFDTQIPYLSKLTYVVRDVENRKITLMFSKNLMEYKEHMPRTSADEPIVSLDAYNQDHPTAPRRHGVIADDVKWTEEELAEDPIILHAGVPYLIKPHMMFIEGTTTYNRQFSIAKRDNPDLFRRLKEAEEIPGDDQMEMIYDGEYTVPTYVVGSSAEGAAVEGTIAAGSMTIANRDGSSFTYKDSENGGTLTYGGESVPYKISNDYTYSFVGTYYKSVMPQYCYFLGWDSQKNKAAFWYARTQDKSGWNWNNETGIIIPNWMDLTGDVRKIHKATSIADPARWTITDAQGVSALECDDFQTTGTTGGAKSYTMDFGGTNFFEIDEEDGGIVTEIDEVKATGETSVYSVNGVYMGNSVKGLAKGLYIVNGQKYVVK